MSDFENWKQDHKYSDEEVLASDYLERTKLEPELVPCACGCDQLRLRFDKSGIERRFIKGHQPRGRKLSAETLEKMQETRRRNRELMIERAAEVGRKIEEMIRDGLIVVTERVI